MTDEELGRDRTFWEWVIDERAVLAGLAIEIILFAVGAGLVEMTAVAGIIGVLRQVVSPARTQRGRARRTARRRKARNQLVQPWTPAHRLEKP